MASSIGGSPKAAGGGSVFSMYSMGSLVPVGRPVTNASKQLV